MTAGRGRAPLRPAVPTGLRRRRPPSRTAGRVAPSAEVPTAGGAAADRAGAPHGEAELDLTVVVPFRDVGPERLARHLQAIGETLSACAVDFELIPVSDGSTDGSEAGVALVPSGRVRPVVLVGNHGKGEALRTGLAMGRGRYLGFIDGDGDIPAANLAAFVQAARSGHPDVIVGSKSHPASSVAYPPLRRSSSAAYRKLVGLLFALPVGDTQTGVKLFRRDVLAEVLPRTVERRFVLDLELLALAHQLGFADVVELPVTIPRRFPSTISPRSTVRMLVDTAATFVRLRLRRAQGPRAAGSSRGTAPGPGSEGSQAGHVHPGTEPPAGRRGRRSVPAPARSARPPPG